MSAHDDVIRALQSVLQPLQGELRLVGRLEDARLGNTSAREVFVFVPDLHLISKARAPSFGAYGFNHAQTDLLARLLEALATLRETWEDTGDHKLVTVQLGDFFDLWREFGGTAHPEAIADDEWGRLRDVLYRGVHRNRPCLRATFLLGNHDTKRGVPLAEIPFVLKAHNRTDSGQPFLFTTHGDAFDVLEQTLDDWLQEFVVHFVGRLTPVNKYPIAQWGQMAGKQNKKLEELKKAIVSEIHDVALPEGAPLVAPDEPLPNGLVQTVDDPTSVTQDAFDRYHEALSRAAAEPAAARLRVVVVGHSHRAAMLWHPDPVRPLLLMDAGAWIEKCEYVLADDGRRVREPNAQLAVIHGNDARIYQVRLRA